MQRAAETAKLDVSNARRRRRAHRHDNHTTIAATADASSRGTKNNATTTRNREEMRKQRQADGREKLRRRLAALDSEEQGFAIEPPLQPGNLLDACTDSATAARRIFVIFLLFTIYSYAAAYAVGHEDLFFGKTLTLPSLDVQLPLTGFFFAVPLAIVGLHLWLLMHLALLAERVFALRRRSRSSVAPSGERLRLGLPSFLLVQSLLLDARPFVRSLLLMSHFVLVVALPLAVLLAMQLIFLPYHSLVLTYWHRGLIVLDVLILSYFWLAIQTGEFPTSMGWLARELPRQLVALVAAPVRIALGSALRIAPWARRRWRQRWIERALRPGYLFDQTRLLVWSAGLWFVLVSTLFIAAFPHDGLDEVLYPIARPRDQTEVASVAVSVMAPAPGMNVGTLIIDPYSPQRAADSPAWLAWRWSFGPDWPQSTTRLFGTQRNLIVRDVAADRDATGSGNARSRKELDASGRDLRYAMFINVELRDANFARADLGESWLIGVSLQNVAFTDTRLTRMIWFGVTIDGARVEESDLNGALFWRSELRKIEFRDTTMFGALFWHSQIDNSLFAISASGAGEHGDLHGVSFIGTQLRLVKFDATLNLAQWRSVRAEGVELAGGVTASEIDIDHTPPLHLWLANPMRLGWARAYQHSDLLLDIAAAGRPLPDADARAGQAIDSGAENRPGLRRGHRLVRRDQFDLRDQAPGFGSSEYVHRVALQTPLPEQWRSECYGSELICREPADVAGSVRRLVGLAMQACAAQRELWRRERSDLFELWRLFMSLARSEVSRISVLLLAEPKQSNTAEIAPPDLAAVQNRLAGCMPEEAAKVLTDDLRQIIGSAPMENGDKR